MTKPRISAEEIARQVAVNYYADRSTTEVDVKLVDYITAAIQSAERDTREEDAKIADSYTELYLEAARSISNAIRSRKEGEQNNKQPKGLNE